MSLVEQAVFTSAETSHTAGYQLVARSPGISDADSRALSMWGPSHGSLLKSDRQSWSINFHGLPSGNFCVSRTTGSGNEYSGRGTRIYTQCLVVSPETLEQFANSPFALVRAASGSGLLKQHERVPAALEPAQLVGRTPAVNPAVLSRARRELGAEASARLVQAALRCTSLVVFGTPFGELAVATLINCLPPAFRPEFTFSTGLRSSARRPFRVLAVGHDAEQRRRARQSDEATLVDFSSEPAKQFPPADGWARAIQRILDTGRTSLLIRWFDGHASLSSLDQLNVAGLELLEELEGNVAVPASIAFDAPLRDEANITDAEQVTPAPTDSTKSPRPSAQLAHAAHSQFQGVSAKQDRTPGPSRRLAAEHPEVVASLETLDDLVYNAIKGSASSLEQLQKTWPRIKAELGDDLLIQSREQYLRYALQVWDKCVEASGVRPTDRAVKALEVLCLLFDEV